MLPADAKIASTWDTRLEYGYPVPYVERNMHVHAADAALRKHGVWSRGRFGSWKYEVANQDHSCMLGLDAVDSMLFGGNAEGREATFNSPNAVNSKFRPYDFDFNPQVILLSHRTPMHIYAPDSHRSEPAPFAHAVCTRRRSPPPPDAPTPSDVRRRASTASLAGTSSRRDARGSTRGRTACAACSCASRDRPSGWFIRTRCAAPRTSRGRCARPPMVLVWSFAAWLPLWAVVIAAVVLLRMLRRARPSSLRPLPYLAGSRCYARASTTWTACRTRPRPPRRRRGRGTSARTTGARKWPRHAILV